MSEYPNAGRFVELLKDLNDFDAVVLDILCTNYQSWFSIEDITAELEAPLHENVETTLDKLAEYELVRANDSGEHTLNNEYNAVAEELLDLHSEFLVK